MASDALTRALDWGPLWLCVLLAVVFVMFVVMCDDERFGGPWE